MTTTQPLPAPVYDLAHAETLAGLWRDRYRWAAHRGAWMRWTGRRWEPITDQQAAAQAAEDLRKNYAEALSWSSATDAVKRLTRLTVETCSFQRVNGGLSFLKGKPGFHTEADEWDADPWLLNVKNGIIDLKTGTMEKHDPKRLLTKLAPVDYDPNARGPAWEEHLSYFLPSDDVRRQVQRDLGMALVGGDLQEMLPIWYGAGANGKSTTARAIQAVLGDYAMQAAPNLLIQRRHEQHPTELADLVGRRAVFSIEVGATARLDEAKVKGLTGGDRVKARYMRQDFFEFASTWTIFLLCNHRPTITGTDGGIWRRVRLIPWAVSIPVDQQEPQEAVVERLTAEGSAILRWLLDGLSDWQQEPHWIAAEVQAATADYRTEQDRLAGFLADCCELRQHTSAGVGELYDAYSEWCESNGEEALGKRAFGERLRDRGLSQRKADKGLRRWVGMRLNGQVAQGGNVSNNPPGKNDSTELPESLPPYATPDNGDNGHYSLSADYVGPATWHNRDHDEPVAIVAGLGLHDGEQWFQIVDDAGNRTGAPASDLSIRRAPDDSDLSDTERHYADIADGGTP
jgi:putative DNA primase/helicase